MKWLSFTLLLAAFLVLLLPYCKEQESPLAPPYGEPDIIETPDLVYPITGAAQVIGVNTNTNTPINVCEPFYRLRVYNPWRYTQTKTGQMWQPSATGNSNFDSYYADALKAGHLASPCTSWKMDYMTTLGPYWENEPVNDKGTSPANPFSYGEWSRYWWQCAARYGTFSWEPQYITLNQIPRWNGDPVNQPKTALNLVKYYEPENEPDRWWLPLYANYTPTQCAAMMSAAADGHCGQMGFGTGVRCSDPGAQVVLSGLTCIDTAYLQSIVNWSNQNRLQFYGLPFQVVNVHWYTNKGNTFTEPHVQLTGPGVCPEKDSLKQRLQKLVSWRNRNAPGCEIWLSEFGWDTDNISVQRATPYGNYDSEDVQSMWICRAYLECIAAGINGAYLYELANEYTQVGLFASSGVVSSEATGFQKKKAWNAIRNLTAHLNGFDYAGDYSTGAYRKYKFTNESGEVKYAVWCPTQDGSTVTIQGVNGPILVTENPQFIK